MEKIISDLKQLSINVNMNNNTHNAEQQQIENRLLQKRFVMDNLKLIHPFSGQKEELAMYIGAIENMVPNIAALQPEDRILFFNCILRTLSGAALNAVRREQPENWTALKKILIMEFGEHENISHLILSMNNIKFKGSIKKLCEEINNLICRIKDAIKLCNEPEERKIFFNNEINFYSLKTLKKELPNHLTALLNANLVNDFQTAIQKLRESGEFGGNVHYKSDNYRNYGQPHKSNSNRAHYNPNYLHQHNEYLDRNQNTNQIIHPQNFLPNSYETANRGLHPQNFSPNNYQNPHLQNARNPQSNSNYNHNKRMREYDSNQSRIRRYGAPIPMEVENFHLKASRSYPPF